MHTTLDCLPCFLPQTLYAARLCSPDVRVQKRIMAGVLSVVAGLDFCLSPPENAVSIYKRIAELGGCGDPFAALKKESNDAAVQLRPRLDEIIARAADPAATAVKLAMAGNIIDYGAQQSFDVEQTIDNCLAGEPWGSGLAQFLDEVQRAGRILYLADNCGELVFDGLFIKQLAGQAKEVVLAVKERPIINDALLVDAVACGLDQYCTVITNGTGCPGTPLTRCSDTFQEIFFNVDLIISKGQGNFETLAGTNGPIYYLLTVKCAVVADHLEHLAGRSAISGKGRPGLGAMVLLKNPDFGLDE
jgi:uncharacterized protein with ATP-grasp and redox domains